MIFNVRIITLYLTSLLMNTCCCCCSVASVVSDSVRPHRRHPSRLLCPCGGLPFPSPTHACMLSRFSRVRLYATLWTTANQAPLSTVFSRQEYWSGLPFPSPDEYLGCYKFSPHKHACS